MLIRLFSLFLTLLLFCSPALALIIGVPGNKPTIQAGIDAASPGDTVLVQPGRYLETIDFKGKNIVVGSLFLATQDTSYNSQTIIDGNKNGTVVTFKNGETEKAELCGFTVTGGFTKYKEGGLLIVLSWGGGIYCFNSSPHLHHLIVENNQTQYNGGGMNLQKSNSVIDNCVIRNNRAVGAGGGLYIDNGNNKINNCIIENNQGVGGAAACSESKVIFFKVLITKTNLSNEAMEISLSDVNIINCTIVNNYSDTFQVFYSDVNIDGSAKSHSECYFQNDKTILCDLLCIICY